MSNQAPLIPGKKRLPKAYENGALAFILLGVVVICISWLIVWDLSKIRATADTVKQLSINAHQDYLNELVQKKCEGKLEREHLGCVLSQTEIALDHSRADRDLLAQQTMAKFTTWMAYSTIFGVLVGSVTLFYLMKTYWETRRISSITRDVGEAQIEAHLAFENPRIQHFVSHPETGEPVSTLSFDIKNIGLTSASEVNSFLEFEIDGGACRLEGNSISDLIPSASRTAWFEIDDGSPVDSYEIQDMTLKVSYKTVFDDKPAQTKSAHFRHYLDEQDREFRIYRA